MKPCPAASTGVCAVKGGIPGCSNAKLGCPLLREGRSPWNKPVRPNQFVGCKLPFRSRRIRGCAAPEDWSVPERQEFVGACGGSRAGAPEERREIAVLIRLGAVGIEGLGDASPGERGAAHEVAAGERPFPEKIRRIDQEVHPPFLNARTTVPD
jgi:hypothetical protein